MKPRALLMILDGFGIGKDSPFNAIQNARMPFYRKLWNDYPHSQLITHGEAVGLPEGIMGNSEVGHMTMGAGRIIYQDLTRILKEIKNGNFFSNPALLQVIDQGAKTTGRVHLMGLLSDGGVHSHLEHLFALLECCAKARVPEVWVHAFLDGRDTPPGSCAQYLAKLTQHPSYQAAGARLASLGGRFWAMDRDKRWERVKSAYESLTGQTPPSETSGNSELERALNWIEKQKSLGKTDEFVEPCLLDANGGMHDGDSVIFFNFRSDRAREITQALTFTGFNEFDRGRGFKPSAFAGMTTIDAGFKNITTLYGPQNLDHLMGQWLEQHGRKQFRIAETEKYAHVTFFFNGGREAPFHGEERLLVPSPKDVATYDLKPEMSAFEVAAKTADRIRSQNDDFILMNFANADMVGHTGNYEAAVRAMETLDQCMSQVIGAAQAEGVHVLLTADHGNAEEMCDSQGRIHTQHTLNPVPALWVAPNTAIAPKASRVALRDGTLADLMPTLCGLLGLPLPAEVSGKSLVGK